MSAHCRFAIGQGSVKVTRQRQGLKVRDSRLDNYPRRWNAAPSQELLVVRHNPKTGERSLDLLKWGLIP
jgi:putative SOS response-associated peptidase YedK